MSNSSHLTADKMDIMGQLGVGAVVSGVVRMKCGENLTMGQVHNAARGLGAWGIADITSAPTTTTIGPEFTINITVSLPGALGNVTVDTLCEVSGCLKVSSLSGQGDVEEGTGVVVEGSTQGSELELSQSFAFDNSTVVTMVTISVTLNGVTADSVTVTITQPGLDISYDENNIPKVDAGSVVLTPVSLSSPVTMATITCNDDVISSTVDCDITTCTITSSVSEGVTAGSNLMCVMTVSFLSHPTRGRTYTATKSLTIGYTAALTVSVDTVPDTGIGKLVSTYLRINYTEVTSTLDIEVLCDSDDALYLQSITLPDTITELSRSIQPTCGRVTISLVPDTPPSLNVVQRMLVVGVVYTLNRAGSARYHVEDLEGGGVWERVQELGVCTPEVDLTASLSLSPPHFVSGGSAANYTVTITNNGSCNLYLGNIYIDEGVISNGNVNEGAAISGGILDDGIFKSRSFYEGVVLPKGAERVVEWVVDDFPEGKIVIDPTVTVLLWSSLDSTIRDERTRTIQLPALYLLSPVISITPSHPELIPGEVVEVEVEVMIPYLLTQPSLLEVSVVSQGCDVMLTSVTESDGLTAVEDGASSGYQLTTTTPNNATTLTMGYRVTVPEPADLYLATWTFQLQGSIEIVERSIKVLLPELEVTTSSNSVGGVIPGDSVSLSITLQHVMGETGADAEQVTFTATPPVICTGGQLYQDNVQVAQNESGSMSVVLGSLPLTSPPVVLELGCIVPSTVETESRAYTFALNITYRTGEGEDAWLLTRSFSSKLQLGEPGIELEMTGDPLPSATLTITCLVTLRKGAENMTLGFEISEDLVLLSISLSRIGSYIVFADSSRTSLSVPPSTNILSYDLGLVTCLNESTIGGAENSFSVEMTVLLNSTTAPFLEQGITATVKYGRRSFIPYIILMLLFSLLVIFPPLYRGEDTSDIGFTAQYPDLTVSLACTVDGSPCPSEDIQVDTTSDINYSLTLAHTPNSTGTAYNILIQLYVPLYDIEIVDSTSNLGLTVTDSFYVLYGITNNGAFVMSTSFNEWMSIPQEIWQEATDAILPLTGPWPADLTIAGALKFTARTPTPTNARPLITLVPLILSLLLS
eukprot:sb/3461389/